MTNPAVPSSHVFWKSCIQKIFKIWLNKSDGVTKLAEISEGQSCVSESKCQIATFPISKTREKPGENTLAEKVEALLNEISCGNDIKDRIGRHRNLQLLSIYQSGTSRFCCSVPNTPRKFVGTKNPQSVAHRQYQGGSMSWGGSSSTLQEKFILRSSPIVDPKFLHNDAFCTPCHPKKDSEFLCWLCWFCLSTRFQWSFSPWHQS